LQGVGPSDQITTTTFLRVQFAQATLDQTNQIDFVSCTVQGSLTAFALSNSNSTVLLNNDVEGSGTYLAIGSTVTQLTSVGNTVGKTYMTGSATTWVLADAGSVKSNSLSTPTVTAGTVPEGITSTRVGLQASGWPQVLRLGPTWDGATLGLAANVRATSATQGYLDDTGTAGMLCEVSADNTQFVCRYAPSGANPRTFSNVFLADTTGVSVPSLPSSNPGAGSKRFWYDPADSNRIKFAP
jgi:hypothetical protein